MTTYLIRNPRILWLLIAVILVTGVSSFIIVPRMEDPTLTERGGILNTRLPGADAERVESLVTKELLKTLRQFEEIKELRSASRPGISTIGIILKDEITDVDEVWARVRDKLDSTKPRLGTGATEPDLEVASARAFSYIISLTWVDSNPIDYASLRRWTSEAEDTLRSVRNTEDVERFGDPTEEIRVEVRQDQLIKLGMTVDQLARQLADSDSKIAAGKIHAPASNLLLEIGGKFDSLERIRRTVVGTNPNGQTAYLADLADVSRTITDPPSSRAIVDGLPAIMIGAMVNKDARLDLWSRDVERKLVEFSSILPPTLRLDTLFRQSDYVDARMNNLLRALFISAMTVVGVVFLMMGWRSGLIVGSAMPLAACLVFASLRFLGIPFHQMSLSGLVIALGMLEGAAIIMVDEVQHHIRAGVSKIESVKLATSHMFLPLFGATATTMISFMPIAMMPGPSGEFVGTIGTSVILAVGAAFGLALSIIPTLSALTSSSPGTQSSSLLHNGFSNARLSRWYKRSLYYTLSRPWTTTIVGLALCVPGFLILPLFSVQFFPGADRNQFHCEVELSAQASLAQTEETARQIREVLINKPGVERCDWVIGQSAPSFYYNMIGRVKDSSRYAQALVKLADDINVTEFIRAMQRELDTIIPQAQIRVRQLEQGPPYNAPLEIQFFGSDPEVLRDLGEQARRLLAQNPNVIQAQADLTDQLPKIVLEVREEESRRAGIDLSEMARQLDAAIEGRLGGSLLEGTEELPVRVRLAERARADLTSINSIELLPRNGNTTSRVAMSLSSLTTPMLTVEPAIVSRLDDQRINEVRAYVRAGVLPSTVLNWLKNELDAGEIDLPPGYEIKFGGEASKRSEAIGQLMSRVSLLVVATIFVLVFTLQSFRASGVITMVAVCSCGIAFLALFISGFPLGFTAIVGMMGMVGVAINDSMVVLSELRYDKKARTGDLDAIIDLVMRSSRHVLSTTLTVGCSFVPMVLGGGTFWPPMAMVVVGGVFGATAIALYWIPAVHQLMPMLVDAEDIL